ncbi:hypothetical protein ABEO75_20130 [Paenibacillus macerans]|uniref:hypothetical protein n=1 Tax=Paenibacillus macerans TaxID=44252 RepID=UPI002E1CCB27|nr:hypothetical protein [Paenibacillus macerans]
MGLNAFDIDSNGYLVDANITVPNDLSATGGVKKVELNWTKTANAAGYNVYRSLTAGGPYEKIASSVTAVTYADENVYNGTTYYYVITALNNINESIYSKEVFATPQEVVTEPEQPSGNRAILVVTMTTGLEKEFDLSMEEVNDFISWYEAKQTGSGKASYAIDKHDNNKGPFSARKDYVIFDKILTFEVNEYNVTNE